MLIAIAIVKSLNISNYSLFDYYKAELTVGRVGLPINNEASNHTIKRFDSNTFALFSEIFKGVGRTPDSGNKKGGVKAQTLLALNSLVRKYVELGAGCINDKDFLGQLMVKKGILYVFDKGYVNYKVYQSWTN